MEVSRSAQEFDCTKCAHHHCDETGEIEGSRGPAPFPKWVVNGAEYRTCPLPMITQVSRTMITLYSHYKDGHLPVQGGLLNQPAGFLRAVEIINTVPVKKE